MAYQLVKVLPQQGHESNPLSSLKGTGEMEPVAGGEVPPETGADKDKSCDGGGGVGTEAGGGGGTSTGSVEAAADISPEAGV